MQATIRKLHNGAPFESRGARLLLAHLPYEAEAAWRSAAEALGALSSTVTTLDDLSQASNNTGATVLVTKVGLAESVTHAARIAEVAASQTVVAICSDATYLPLWRAIAWDATTLSDAHPELVLEAAFAQAARRVARQRVLTEFHSRRQSLTADESQVFESVCAGLLNKQIASEIGVSVRTIEQRRRRVFEKMDVESAVPLAALTATVRTIAEQSVRRRHDDGAAGRSVPAPSFPAAFPRVTPTMGSAFALGR